LWPGNNLSSIGFIVRNGGGASIISGDGSGYVYMAFADEPGLTPFDTFANSR